jgi:hypothetical protein
VPMETLDHVRRADHAADVRGQFKQPPDMLEIVRPDAHGGGVLRPSLRKRPQRFFSRLPRYRSVDCPRIFTELLVALCGDIPQAIALQRHHAPLYMGIREDAQDALLELFQSVDADKQHPLNPSGFQLIEDRHPEMRALVLTDPKAQYPCDLPCRSPAPNRPPCCASCRLLWPSHPSHPHTRRRRPSPKGGIAML